MGVIIVQNNKASITYALLQNTLLHFWHLYSLARKGENIIKTNPKIKNTIPIYFKRMIKVEASQAIPIKIQNIMPVLSIIIL